METYIPYLFLSIFEANELGKVYINHLVNKER